MVINSTSHKMADKSPAKGPENNPSSSEKARRVIEDAFRRADKNDDGSLSMEEFQTYFSDGTITKTQLEELFSTIDTHKTNNIDVRELCDYFLKFWGPFESLFASLDDLSVAVTSCIHQTAQHYGSKTVFEQFATRFLMKEALSHIHAVEKPLEHVNDSLEEKAIEERPEQDTEPVAVDKKITPRWQQRLERSISQQPDRQDSISSAASCTSLSKEVSRLSKLIDKLENKVSFSAVEEEEVHISSQDNLILLVSYDIRFTEDDQSGFEGYVKQYIESMKTQAGCLHVMVRKHLGENRVVIYEVWEDKDTYESHSDSVVRKTFKDACEKYTMDTKHFEIPESWWPAM